MARSTRSSKVELLAGLGSQPSTPKKKEGSDQRPAKRARDVTQQILDPDIVMSEIEAAASQQEESSRQNEQPADQQQALPSQNEANIDLRNPAAQGTQLMTKTSIPEDRAKDQQQASVDSQSSNLFVPEKSSNISTIVEDQTQSAQSNRSVFTDAGEEILGYKAVRMVSVVDDAGNRFRVALGNNFVLIVRRKGAGPNGNPIAYRKSGAVGGPKIVEEYLKSKGKDAVNIVDSQNQVQSNTVFKELLGFDCAEHKGGDRFPEGYAYVKYQDDTEHILSRTALRKLCGVSVADKMIENFFIERGLNMPFRPKTDKRAPYRRSSRMSSTAELSEVKRPSRTGTTELSEIERTSRTGTSELRDTSESPKVESTSETSSDSREEQFEALQRRNVELEQMLKTLIKNLQANSTIGDFTSTIKV